MRRPTRPSSPHPKVVPRPARSQLRAFETAGRTGSFRAAAAELNLTPSAVSHAVRKLEEALGSPNSPVRRFTLVGGLLGVTFGYWVAIWTSNYWPLVTGGKAIASWIPYTIIGFEMMVMIGALSTVFGMFYVNRIPRLTMTVGYDPRFSHGDYGVFVATDNLPAAEELLRRHGAAEVRGER